MLDFDLAELYGTETKYLKRSVRANIQRFPKDFMFELSEDEWENLRCRFSTSSREETSLLRSSFSTLEKDLRSQIASSSSDTKMLGVIGENVNVQGMRSQIVTASEQRYLRSQSATLKRFKCKM